MHMQRCVRISRFVHTPPFGCVCTSTQVIEFRISALKHPSDTHPGRGGLQTLVVLGFRFTCICVLNNRIHVFKVACDACYRWDAGLCGSFAVVHLVRTVEEYICMC